MSNVYTIGIGMNQFGKCPEETVRTMARHVVENTHLNVTTIMLDEAAPLPAK